MDAATILVGVVACLLSVFVLRLIRRWSRLPPGPWGLPVVGYIPYLSRKPYLDLQRLAKKYGNVFSIRLGSNYVVVLNDFKSTRDAFNQDAFIGRPPESPFDLNKETIETEALSGLPWKEQKRFSLHMLKDLGFGKTRMEEHIREEITEFLECLEKQAGKPYCIYELLAPSMSNNIGSFVFGERLKYDDPNRQMLTRVLKEFANAAAQVTWHVFFPWAKKLCKVLGIGDVDRVKRANTKMKKYTMTKINEHEKTLNDNNIRDFIDGYLLEIQKRTDDPSFCKPVLQDLVGAFFGAGSETVRLTVEWLLLTVAVHQDAQLEIQKEIDEVIGPNRFPSRSDHKLMPFTEAFIMELMRWRTIIPINILRYAITDGELNGYRIPQGSQLLGNLWAVHHDPDYWGADAEEFKPERFLTEDGKAVKIWEHFIPFSIGKRQCPGEPLAKTEVFMYFTSILQRFHVRVPDGKQIDFEGILGIGLQPKPQELIFTKRN